MRRFKFAAFVIMILLLVTLTACVVTKYDAEEEKIVEEHGRAMIEAYLETLPEKCSIESLYMMNGREKGEIIWAGYYLSYVVEAVVKTNSRKFRVYADVKDGRMWSGYYTFDLAEAVETQMKPYCERYDFTGDFKVTNPRLCYRVESPEVDTIHNNWEKVDTEVYFYDVIPVEYDLLSEQERIAATLKDCQLSSFNLVCFENGSKPFDIRILADYLEESGNYISDPDDRDNADGTYRVSSYLEEYGREPMTGSLATIVSEIEMRYPIGGEATFSMEIYDYVKDQGFEFRYRRAHKEGAVKDIDSCPLTEYQFPLELEEGKISYYGNGSVMLFFKEAPSFAEVSRVVYKDGKAGEPEKLIANQPAEGVWSLTREAEPDEYVYWFSGRQEIIFK